MTPRLASAAVLVLVAATACSGSSSSNDAVTAPPSSSATPGGTSDGGSTLTIKGFRYSALQVAPGTTITVKNLDDAEHTVTSDVKGLFSVDDIGGTPKTLTAPTKPGTYTFHCEYHASMHGSITVT